MIRIQAKTDRAIRAIERLRAGLAPEALDRVVDRVALETFANLVKETPKKWTGQTRKAWRIERLGPASRRILNPSKVMWWLEYGTKDHGPKRAKALFIPLTRRDLNYYATGFGSVMAILQSGRRVKLRYGVDYILTKRVRGIIGSRMTELETVKAKKRLQEAITIYITQLKARLGFTGQASASAIA